VSPDSGVSPDSADSAADKVKTAMVGPIGQIQSETSKRWDK